MHIFNTRSFKRISLLSAILVLVLFNSCKKSESSSSGINIFSLNDDKTFGAQTAQEINNNPSQYPLLDETQYANAYFYLRQIRDRILNSGKVNHKNDFDWQVKIIKDDSTLNAFCTPGGYIYVYTGIIKYLDTEDQLAGVLGHEIAHADRRHSTIALTEQYGLQTMLDVVIGKNQNSLTQIASSLIQLKYSRNHESEADEYSVIYLSGTSYECNGAAGFFEKINGAGSGSGTPEFLSTHPNPDNRIQNINQKAASISCSTNPSGLDYASFKAMMP